MSYSHNGEDIRIWRAFGPDSEHLDETLLTYVEVGAIEPRDGSLSASLYDLGWRGLLVAADMELAGGPRTSRPGDVVETTASGRSLDEILDAYTRESMRTDIHILSIDVQATAAQAPIGLSLTHHRPWVACLKGGQAVANGPGHAQWESHLARRDYREITFDGVNRWFVAEERADQPIADQAGAEVGMSIAEAIAMPVDSQDVGQYGWVSPESERRHRTGKRAVDRSTRQREAILDEARQHARVPESEHASNEIEGSKGHTVRKQATRIAWKLRFIAQRTKGALPTPVADYLVRERHLKHVTINMGHLTDPAFMGEVPEDTIEWVGSNRPPLPPGLGLAQLPGESVTAIRNWLDSHPFDSDEQLDARMDNQDDEVGRVQSALRTRLRLADSSTNATRGVRGDRIAFDSRALQSPAFGTRGIGRFAKALLDGVREGAGEDRITLIVNPGLHPLPEYLVGHCQQLPRIDPADSHRFGALIQPSPMTHSPEPLVPLLRADIHKVAVVFDFIPLHYPSIYLKNAAARAEYAADLDALSHYTEYLAISQVVADELTEVLARFNRVTPDFAVQVAWPRDVTVGSGTVEGSVDHAGPIVLMTGDDARKNTFGGLAGIAAATSDEAQRDVVVVGMAGQGTRVHHWSIAAAMRPGEATTVGHITDSELSELLESASCVVVPSFDEGLSLPVIEALRAGVPVVASDIPAHRELIGTGAFSCEPDSPRSIAKAIRKVRGTKTIARSQIHQLHRHGHAILEDTIASIIEREVTVGARTSDPGTPERNQATGTRERWNIGIATPWPPQRSGVADFSRAVFTELADMADVTVYTTSDGLAEDDSGISLRSITEVLDDPNAVSRSHDVFVSVVGNSHYHLLPVKVLQSLDAIVIAHDTRMVEFYTALRGKAGAERVMSIVPLDTPQVSTELSLDDQIDDMRLLTNAGFWEVANRARQLILHSPSAAPAIATQTGRQVRLLPFANYRAPNAPMVTEQERTGARDRLGLNSYPAGTIHLGSFGYVDVRTKMTDIVVESAAWLAQWSHPVALHLVGAASPQEEQQLRDQARRAGLDNFQITGYISEERYRDWLMAVDVGIQLRISPLLGVSGPLSDFAAYGTPAVASNGQCVDVDTPDFIHRLPDAVSPVLVAEAIEQMLSNPTDAVERERQRQTYLREKPPRRYAVLLLEMLQEPW